MTKAKSQAAKENKQKTNTPLINKIFTTIPFNQLYLSKDNVRITPSSPDKDDELRASIAAVGIIQNLVVVKDDGQERYGVHAGGRRFLRIGELVDQGVFTNDYPTPVIIVDKSVSLDMSLMENLHEPMNEADQFVAFDRLIKAGKSINEIARHYSMAELDVKRVLKLANAASELLEEYRNKKMSIEQLMALCLTDDPLKQKQVWFSDRPDWEKSANHIRKTLMADDVSLSNKKVIFVGIDTYLEHGGLIIHDLFSMDGTGGYISNMPLLNELVSKKLKAISDEILLEGWAWVEAVEDVDHNQIHQFKRIYRTTRPLTEDETKYNDSLNLRQEQYWELREAHEEKEYESEAAYDEVESQLSADEQALETEIEAFKVLVECWGEQQAMAGVYIYIDHQGKLSRTDGLVRREDAKRMQAETSDENASAGIEEKSGLSQSLKDNLMAHRTSAIQVAISESPKLATILLVHRLMIGTFDKYRYQSSLSSVQVDCSQPALHINITDYPLTKSAKVMQETTDKWLAILPEVTHLLDWLLMQDESVIQALLAYCVSKACSFTHHGHNANYSKIGELLTFSMHDWWEPTAENYFKRVSKAEMKAVLVATEKSIDSDSDKMKKSELAQVVAGKIAGSGWLPELLKTS